MTGGARLQYTRPLILAHNSLLAAHCCPPERNDLERRSVAKSSGYSVHGQTAQMCHCNPSVNGGNLYESVIASHAPPWRGNPGKRASLAHMSRLPRRSHAGAVVAPRKNRKEQHHEQLAVGNGFHLDCASHACAFLACCAKAVAWLQHSKATSYSLFLVPPTTEWLRVILSGAKNLLFGNRLLTPAQILRPPRRRRGLRTTVFLQRYAQLFKTVCKETR